MNKLTCIKIFTQVARLNSFTAAADELNMTQGAVSKKIAWLESDLGFTLFHRSSRSINLTDAGMQYLAFCQQFLEQMRLMETGLRNELSKVIGELKISVPSAFATQQLAKPVSEFLALHPEVSISLSVNDRPVDLLQDDIDIALRVNFLKDSSLKARKLMDHPMCFFASPDYVAQQGVPTSVSEISEHTCITFSIANPADVWQIGKEKYPVKAQLTSDSPEMIVEMALLGHGIAIMPRWMVQRYFDNGRLLELFTAIEKPSLPMYVLYKNSDYIPYRVKAFVDFFVGYFET